MDAEQILKFMPPVMIQCVFKSKQAKRKSKRLTVGLIILESCHSSEYLLFLAQVPKELLLIYISK